MRQSLTYSFIITCIVTTVLFLCLQLGFAQVRSSANYQLQSDSINIGGGLSSSTSYVQESTVGEIATGVSSSTNYQLRAGYQQMQEVFISISEGVDVFMAPDIGVVGGTSDGYTQVTVTTDSPSGYSLTIEAENSPAMRNGANTILDYQSQPGPYPIDFDLYAQESAFGYAPFGSDVVAYFLDDGGGFCDNGGTFTTPLTCWAGLSTTPVIIAQGSVPNHPLGSSTDIDFRVQIESGADIVSGEYIATTTLTALPL